jgi:GTP-binding protein YchF
MNIGITGLQTSGKTTFFNLLTHSDIETATYSSGKTDSHIGTARIPDERIDFLSDLYRPQKTTYATMELTDLPGLVKGASVGKGVGNRFLESVRRVDALVQIVRAFKNDDVVHVEGSIDPRRDIDTINLELLLADLGIIEARIERIENSKKINSAVREELEVLKKCRDGIEKEIPIHSLNLSDLEKEYLKTFNFLSVKPMLLVINIDEEQLSTGQYPQKQQLYQYAGDRGFPIIEVCAQVEVEIDRLGSEDRKLFMEEMGIKESGIDRLARAIYDYFGLISFLTAGTDEVKAWTIKKGTTALKAAGKIHSDIERGFIRAEVVKYQTLKELGSMAKVKEKGLYRLEGKDYIVEDGDIINFRFNV